jgi:hypothetical protein
VEARDQDRTALLSSLDFAFVDPGYMLVVPSIADRNHRHSRSGRHDNHAPSFPDGRCIVVGEGRRQTAMAGALAGSHWGQSSGLGVGQQVQYTAVLEEGSLRVDEPS